MRRTLAFASVMLLGSAQRAYAEPCGCGVSRVDQVTNSVTARLVERIGFGIAKTERFEGDYEFLATSLGVSYRSVFVDVGVPFYRVMRNGLEAYGIGDFSGSLRLAWQLEATQLAIYVGVMFPTGDARVQLGMGHWMVSAGASIANEHAIGERLRGVGFLSIGYQAALDAAGHSHGPQPFVDPMNASEAVVHARYGLGILMASQERLDFEIHGGAGIPPQQGAPRATLGGRVSWRIGEHHFAAEAHGAVLGNPYQIRSFLEYGFRYR